MALRYLRDNLKSLKWVLWGVVIVLFGLVFFGWGGFDPQQARRQDVAATVGNEHITFAEFQRAYQDQESLFRQAFGDQFNRDLIRQYNLPKRALDGLIDRRILLMEARDVGLEVNDEEVRDAILEISWLKDEDGRFIGAEQYRNVVRRGLRMDVDQFETTVRDDLLLQKLDAVLAATTYVSETVLERTYRDQNESARIRWVELPASEFADLTAEPSDLEAYFADHQDDYRLPEQRAVDYLLVDTIKLRREIEIPEDELRAYYDDHGDEFTRDEQVRARHILFQVGADRPDDQARQDLLAVRGRIEAGADFGELARELSEDEGSAASGGSLGYFGRGQMIAAFEEAAFGAQVGEIVGPIKTDFGYHLIEVQDHRQGGLQPFDQAQAVIRARLIGERVEEIAAAKARDVSERLKSGAAVDGDDPMAALAAEEGLTLETSEPFGRDETVAGIGRSPAFAAAVFDLAEGEISEPIKIPRGWVIARLAEILPPRVPELGEVEDQVRLAVEQEKRGEAARARLSEARANLAEGADLAALAAGLGVEVRESEEFNRFGSIPGLSSSQKVIDSALSLEEGEWSEPLDTGNGALLFEVVERKTFDPAQFEDEKDDLRRSQETQQVNQLKVALIDLRRRDLNPTIDRRVTEVFEADQSPVGGSPGS